MAPNFGCTPESIPALKKNPESCVEPTHGDCNLVGPHGNQTWVLKDEVHKGHIKNMKGNPSACTPKWSSVRRMSFVHHQCKLSKQTLRGNVDQWRGNSQRVPSKSHDRKKLRFQITLPLEHFSMSSEDCNHNGTRVSPPQENDKLLPVWIEFCFDILLRCSADDKSTL